MTTTTSADPDQLRARMAAAIGGRMAGHIERLGWSATIGFDEGVHTTVDYFRTAG